LFLWTGFQAFPRFGLNQNEHCVMGRGGGEIATMALCLQEREKSEIAAIHTLIGIQAGPSRCPEETGLHASQN
jgi:hypothetical protein